MAKRLITSALIILFLGRIVGYFPIFKFEQFTIRREIKTMLKTAIPDSELEVFSFPIGSKEAAKYGDKHEFKLHGQMYDVVRRKIIGEVLKLYCFHDKAETNLFSKLEKMVNDRMNTSQHPFRRAVNIFQKIFHSTEPLQNILKFQGDSGLSTNLFDYANMYAFEYTQKFVPPPRFSS